jgi:hypothetical protein
MKITILPKFKYVIISAVALSLGAHSAGADFLGAASGGASTGGGNSQTDQARDVEGYFGPNHMHMKGYLKAFVQEIAKYPARAEAAELLQDLLSKGLLEDIDRSKYVFSKKCLEGEEEKDASTLRGVRNADICINIPSLGRIGAKKEQVAGLLMHEHVRHFGVEDTNDTGIHPVAVFLSDHFDYLETTYKGLKLADPELVDRIIQEQRKRNPNYILRPYMYAKSAVKDLLYTGSPTGFNAGLRVYSTDLKSVYLSIEELSDGCASDEALTGRYPDRHSYPLRVGTRIPLNRNQSLYYDMGFFKSFFSVDNCIVKFALENDHGKMLFEPMKLSGIAVYVYPVDLTNRKPIPHVLQGPL